MRRQTDFEREKMGRELGRKAEVEPNQDKEKRSEWNVRSCYIFELFLLPSKNSLPYLVCGRHPMQ